MAWLVLVKTNLPYRSDYHTHSHRAKNDLPRNFFFSRGRGHLSHTGETLPPIAKNGNKFGSKNGTLFQFWLHPFLSLILSPCSRCLAFDSFLAPDRNLHNLLHPVSNNIATPEVFSRKFFITKNLFPCVVVTWGFHTLFARPFMTRMSFLSCVRSSQDISKARAGPRSLPSLGRRVVVVETGVGTSAFQARHSNRTPCKPRLVNPVRGIQERCARSVIEEGGLAFVTLTLVAIAPGEEMFLELHDVGAAR